MYRAYPAPQPQLQPGGTISLNPKVNVNVNADVNAAKANTSNINGNGNSNGNDGKNKIGTSRPIIKKFSSNKSRIPLPGSTIPKYGSPSSSLPPPTKKLRGGVIPILPPQSQSKSNSAASSSSNNFVDEKISQRRAQLQSLKAKSANSSASAILARAKAVTNAKANAKVNANPPPAAVTTIPSTNVSPQSFHRSRPLSLKTNKRTVPAKVTIPADVTVPIPVTATAPVVESKKGPDLVQKNGHHDHLNGRPASKPPPTTVKNDKLAPPPIVKGGIITHPHAITVEPTEQVRPTITTVVPVPVPVPGKVMPVRLTKSDVSAGSPLAAPPTSPTVSLFNNISKNDSTVSPLAIGPEAMSSKRLTLQALREAVPSPPKQMHAHDDSLVNDVKARPKDVAASLSMSDAIGHDAMTDTNTNTNIIADTNTNPTAVAKAVPKVVKLEETTVANAKVNTNAVLETEENQPVQSSQLNLTMRLHKAQQEKEQAMKRMAELESQVMDLRFQHQNKDALSQSQPSMRNGRSTERGDRGVGGTRGGRRRMKSPEPRRGGKDPLKDLNLASKAVETVEEIFQSSNAKFVVRKPYGGNELKDYWFDNDFNVQGHGHGQGQDACSVEWMESVEGYWTKASVKDETSLEVLAKVDADGSILHIHGKSCRHGLPIMGDNGIVTGYEYKIFEDVEYMDGALGKVIFIDGEGNDEEYWLDPIYEEALKIRESYCSNVFSAALALKASEESAPIAGSVVNENRNGPGQVDIVPPSMMMPPAFTPSVADACVDTNDLPQDPSIHLQKSVEQPFTASKEQSASVNSQQNSKEKEQSQIEYENSGSTDILSHFFIAFFSTIVSLVWFILMIPVRVVRFTFTIGILICMVNLLWLYFAGNRNAVDMDIMVDMGIMSKQFNIK